MSKLDVFALPRPERRRETRSFEDPSGVTFTITLQAPDASDMARATEKAAELTETYISGSEIREAAPFPDAEVKPSESLFTTCAVVEEMQIAETPRDAYSALELAILSSRLPAVWDEFQEWVRELVNHWSASRGKSPGAPTA